MAKSKYEPNSTIEGETYIAKAQEKPILEQRVRLSKNRSANEE